MEDLQIFHLLTDTDELDGNVEFALDGEDNTALGSTVELGQDKTGDISGVLEFGCLNDGVLTGGRVENQQRFACRIGQLTADDAVDLGKLVHQVLLVMQTSCSIDDQHIGVTALCGADCIINDRCGIGTFVMADKLDTDTVSPDCDLVDCGGTECVCGGKDNFFAILFEQICDFGNGGGLADTVDADDEDNGRGGGQIQRFALTDHFGKNFHQCETRILRLRDLVAADCLLQRFQNLLGCADTNVGGDQNLFQLLIQIVIDDGVAGEQGGDLLEDSFFGLFQTFF